MKITKHEDLEVYQLAYKAAMEIFSMSLSFPKEEKYSLTDQIRRSSRSVCANIAEAFYRRKYPRNFAAHLSDSLAEAAETKVWLDFSCDCNYINSEIKEKLNDDYSKIIGKLIIMINQSDLWKI
jgi:four helix bundle protein